MFKMGSHNPFGNLKHKLGPKEGPGVKLTIWLLSTKSQESPQFPCVEVACDIPLESFWRELKLCFKPHLNRRFTHKVMGPQSHQNPNCENFGTPTWESRDKIDIWVLVLWQATKYTMRGRWWLPPSLGCGEFCDFEFARGSS